MNYLSQNTMLATEEVDQLALATLPNEFVLIAMEALSCGVLRDQQVTGRLLTLLYATFSIVIRLPGSIEPARSIYVIKDRPVRLNKCVYGAKYFGFILLTAGTTTHDHRVRPQCSWSPLSRSTFFGSLWLVASGRVKGGHFTNGKIIIRGARCRTLQLLLSWTPDIICVLPLFIPPARYNGLGVGNYYCFSVFWASLR